MLIRGLETKSILFLFLFLIINKLFTKKSFTLNLFDVYIVFYYSSKHMLNDHFKLHFTLRYFNVLLNVKVISSRIPLISFHSHLMFFILNRLPLLVFIPTYFVIRANFRSLFPRGPINILDPSLVYIIKLMFPFNKQFSIDSFLDFGRVIIFALL